LVLPPDLTVLFSPPCENFPASGTGDVGAAGPPELESQPMNAASITATTDTRMDLEDIDGAPVVIVIVKWLRSNP
jgi:hypothetical protein